MDLISKLRGCLHRDRISLNRIISIDIEDFYHHHYGIEITYLSRRGREYYASYFVSR